MTEGKLVYTTEKKHEEQVSEETNLLEEETKEMAFLARRGKSIKAKNIQKQPTGRRKKMEEKEKLIRSSKHYEVFLSLYSKAGSSAEIGERIGMKPGTVYVHLQGLQKEFGSKVINFDRHGKRIVWAVKSTGDYFTPEALYASVVKLPSGFPAMGQKAEKKPVGHVKLPSVDISSLLPDFIQKALSGKKLGVDVEVNVIINVVKINWTKGG